MVHLQNELQRSIRQTEESVNKTTICQVWHLCKVGKKKAIVERSMDLPQVVQGHGKRLVEGCEPIS